MTQATTLHRRHLLSLLGPAAALRPGSAWADDAPAPAVSTPPATVPSTTPPPSAPGSPTPVPAASVDRTKKYLLFFDQTIDVASMRALRHQLTSLVEGGVQEIELVIHSAGGLIDPMLVTYSFIRALPARITTHANGYVQSAATILFLAGEDRSADRNARFLFHPSTVPFGGTLSGVQMQDRLHQFSTLNGVEAAIFHDRTTLSDDEIARFDREEVIYTPDQALAAGVIQHVRDLHIPGPDKARVLFLD